MKAENVWTCGGKMSVLFVSFPQVGTALAKAITLTMRAVPRDRLNATSANGMSNVFLFLHMTYNFANNSKLRTEYIWGSVGSTYISYKRSIISFTLCVTVYHIDTLVNSQQSLPIHCLVLTRNRQFPKARKISFASILVALAKRPRFQ